MLMNTTAHYYKVLLRPLEDVDSLKNEHCTKEQTTQGNTRQVVLTASYQAWQVYRDSTLNEHKWTKKVIQTHFAVKQQLQICPIICHTKQAYGARWGYHLFCCLVRWSYDEVSSQSAITQLRDGSSPEISSIDTGLDDSCLCADAVSSNLSSFSTFGWMLYFLRWRFHPASSLRPLAEIPAKCLKYKQHHTNVKW